MLPARPPAQRLIVFTRYPRAGLTKTRLIPALGPEGAAGLQRRLAERVLAWARRLALHEPVRLELRHEGGDPAELGRWLGPGLACRPQGPGDLGQRMARAIEEALAQGEERVVLVGSDLPQLNADIMAQAFAALADHSMVLGPATDGGYYLVGLSIPAPAIFQGIAWGTSRVLDETLAAAHDLGLLPHLLPPLADLDRPEDLPLWEQATSPPARTIDPERISVIVPALNEEPNLAACLGPVLAVPGVETIAVDGGSQDGTYRLARRLGARAVLGFRGRARQMNLGAQLAGGGILVFLHADTILPPGWDREVRRVLARPGVALGCFRFALDNPGAGARLVEKMVRLRTELARLPYGDQALFLTREAFWAADGYADLPIMEDYELVRRLGRRGRVAQADLAALTSGRRWRTLGLTRTTLVNQAVVLGFLAGLSPDRLAGWYGRRAR